MKTSPVILLFKSHIDTYTRKDGSVVQAHDDKRTAASKPPAKDWRDEENWHSRMQAKMKTHSEDELRYIHKDATEAADVGEKSGFDSKKTGKYRDEAHYAAMELQSRKKAAASSGESGPSEAHKLEAMKRAEASTRRKFPDSTSTQAAKEHYQNAYTGHLELLTGKK